MHNDNMVPKSMMTQHPDAASKYVSIQQEPEEAIKSLLPEPKGLGIDEIMIDFEGKLTPYQQTAQIVLGLVGRGVKVGTQVRVTPRIPSGRKEGVFRQLMALMSIVESNYKALKSTGKASISEVVLPMTVEANELINLQQRIIDVVQLAHKEFGMSPDPVQIRPIPLVESLPAIINLGPMLKDYREGLKTLGIKLESMRLMIGRSDLALAYGLGAAVLANVVALADMQSLAKEGIIINPILGGGTLPFRGHLTLEHLDQTLEQYPTVKTFTIQSAMRYDHGSKKTAKLASELRSKISGKKSLKMNESERNLLINCIGVFTKNYLQTIKDAWSLIIKVSDLIPEQRDRLARKSEVGYARQLPQTRALADCISDSEVAEALKKMRLAKHELPRAISFTASLYTLGVPPEFIATGASLKEIHDRFGQNGIDLINKFYPSLKSDLEAAAKFLHLSVASSFFKPYFMRKIKADIEYLQQYLDVEIKQADSFYVTVLETLKPMLKQVVSGQYVISEEGLEHELVNELILKLGKLRKALG